MTVTAGGAFLAGLERQLFGGPGWRCAPYPTPSALYRVLNPRAVDTPALRLIDQYLMAAERGEIKRLAIALGPQEGKSERVSRTFQLWSLLRNPDRRLVLASYQDEIATRWGRAVRNDILTHDGTDGTVDLGLRLREDTRAVDRWQLDGHAGGMVTAGIAGALTGRPADMLTIDDPFKDKAAARSRTVRQQVKDFWTATAVPRLAPGAPVVVVHTRWHEADLIGWLLKEQGDEWTYLNIPALAQQNDPLGREPGVWLESARGRTAVQWQRTREEVGESDFAALYQGSPTPIEGGLFQRSAFRHYQRTGDPWSVQLPNRLVNIRHGFRFATVDLAASKKSSADWTVCAAWCMSSTGELILLDLVRVQVDPAQHWDKIRPLVQRWDMKLYVEASQFGTDLIYTAGREGAALDKLVADTDKYTRAVPAARRIAQGQVWFPADAHWLAELEDELAEFPTGQHDDQVDVVAYAHRVVSAYWLADPGQTTATPVAVDPSGGWPVDAVIRDPSRVEF